MTIKIKLDKKIFIIGAIITAAALCVYSFLFSLSESKRLAQADPEVKVNVSIAVAGSGNYVIGKKYSVSWDSDCRGGEVMAWLATASSSDANVGILVPLTNFSATDFGDKGKDDRIFSDDIWKVNLSHNANKGKLSWTVPAQLSLAKSLFSGTEGVYYIYTLADGRFALHKIVKEPVQMPVFPDNYYLRVDIKGKNGCTATGYSKEIKVIR